MKTNENYYFSIEVVKNGKIISNTSFMNGETIHDVYKIAYELAQSAPYNFNGDESYLSIFHHYPDGVKKLTTVLSSAKPKSKYKYDRLTGIYFISEI